MHEPYLTMHLPLFLERSQFGYAQLIWKKVMEVEKALKVYCNELLRIVQKAKFFG